MREANGRGDWLINGHDYGHNFTINICEPVLSDYSDVVDVHDRRNVSGYYLDTEGRKISIGYTFTGSTRTKLIGRQSSHRPFFRGRRLLLEYKDGSRCRDDLYRTTLISFLCDRDLEVQVLVPLPPKFWEENNGLL